MRLTLVLLLSLAATGCFSARKKPRPALPIPPQQAMTKPAPVLSLPPVIAPVETPVERAQAQAKPDVSAVAPATPAPAAARTPAARRNRPASALAPVPASALPPAPETAPQPAPLLREILTPETQARYDAGLSRSIAQARAALTQAAKRKLTPPQRENVRRIETFLVQAEASRKDDIGSALQLARRAELLGQDLLQSLLP